MNKWNGHFKNKYHVLNTAATATASLIEIETRRVYCAGTWEIRIFSQPRTRHTLNVCTTNKHEPEPIHA